MSAFTSPVVGHPATAFGVVISTPESFEIPSGSSNRRDVKSNSLSALLIGIFITLIIFVLVVSIYDVIKECIIVRETRLLTSKRETFRAKEEVGKMNAAAEASYKVAVTFMAVAFAIALLLLPPLFYAY